jgi:CRP-like cAMP-binding protein
MRLAIEPQQFAARVDHHEAVVVRVSRQLEERERQHDVQLARQRLEARDERMAFERMRREKNASRCACGQ